MCHFLSVHQSTVQFYKNHANTNRKKQNKVQSYTQKRRHGRERNHLYIYNLTKLKGNETEEKNKNGTFFYKERKKNRTMLNQQMRRKKNNQKTKRMI